MIELRYVVRHGQRLLQQRKVLMALEHPAWQFWKPVSVQVMHTPWGDVPTTDEDENDQATTH